MKEYKSYLEYIKDNPKGYWFRAKLFGWGWTPAKWQGWLVTIIFVVAVIWVGISLEGNTEPTVEELSWFFIKIGLLVVGIILICLFKGEKPRWSWGFPKK